MCTSFFLRCIIFQPDATARAGRPRLELTTNAAQNAPRRSSAQRFMTMEGKIRKDGSVRPGSRRRTNSVRTGVSSAAVAPTSTRSPGRRQAPARPPCGAPPKPATTPFQRGNALGHEKPRRPTWTPRIHGENRKPHIGRQRDSGEPRHQNHPASISNTILPPPGDRAKTIKLLKLRRTREVAADRENSRSSSEVGRCRPQVRIRLKGPRKSLSLEGVYTYPSHILV